MAAGEFGALHLAQLAIAREHGVTSWAALTTLIETRAQSISHPLSHMRWLIPRFAAADDPGWVAPDEQELREHFSDAVLSSLSSEELTATFAQLAGDLREEFVVAEAKRLVARGEIVGMDVVATVETRPPHRLTGIRAVPLGGRVRDTRAANPTTRTPRRLFTMPAAGGLWATATDLLRFGQRWSSLLPTALAREAVRPQTSQGTGGSKRGLGWTINQPTGLVGAAGQAPDASASLLTRLDDRQANVALANRSARLGPINKQVMQAYTASAPIETRGRDDRS